MTEPTSHRPRLLKRHLQIGWWSILAFLTLGIGLEWLHAAKAPWYLNDAFGTRRELWTLAHAHGVLLGLVHLAFAATVNAIHQAEAKTLKLASYSLSAAGLLMPAGFLLGGAVLIDGEPGPAMLVLPVGGILLVIAVAGTAQSARRGRS